MKQPQFIFETPDGDEFLISFWGGIEELPEVAARVDGTRWGIPLPVREVTW